MLNDLFINVLILISFTFVGGQILKELPSTALDKTYRKIALGVSAGTLGILMLVYRIQVPGTTTLLDLRVLSLIMVSHIGGFIPTLTAGIIIGIFRVTYFGISQSSGFAVFHICLYIIFFHIIDKRFRRSFKSWLLKLAVTVVILVSTLLYLLKGVENVYIIILLFAVIVVSSGVLEYGLLEYVRNSNELYRMYKKDSTKDYLTGLNNMRSFDQLINSSFNKAISNGEKLSCLMVDIDHFKKVNDTYGHAVGDMVLRELAHILKKSCRDFDIIGRVGGEEFCILLMDCPKERSFQIGMKIRNAVKDNEFPIGNDRYINITVSVGSATYPDTISDLELLIKEADDGLYKAKQTGRDRVCGGSD
jgi:diguanylate cyclase